METSVYLVNSNQVNDYTEYILEVHHGGYTWKVKHRYSEFKALHDAIRLKYPQVDKNLLPPKKLFGKMSPTFIDKRKGELEAYVQCLLNVKFARGLPLPLRHFLQFNLYDVEMVCQNLAEKLYRIGDGILHSGSSYTFNTLELWAITERISLQKPSTDSENAGYDFGHLLGFVYNLKYLHIVCQRGSIGTSNIIAEELMFDISVFRSLKQLVADCCSGDQARSFAKLHLILTSLSVHNSLTSLQSILTGGCDVVDINVEWKKLVTADFSDNSISNIDDSVKLMTCIEFLDLSRNQISKIENLHYLTSLTFIDLSHNMISEFHSAHARLGNVKTLILASNKLTSLHGLEKLYSLENLNVSNNLITELDEVDYVSRLPCILQLNLSKNTVVSELDYRTKILSKFGNRACEICLDETTSSQKELDTAAVLHAIFKSHRMSHSGSSTSGSYQTGKSSPIQIQRHKTAETAVFSAPGRFCVTPETLKSRVTSLERDSFREDKTGSMPKALDNKVESYATSHEAKDLPSSRDDQTESFELSLGDTTSLSRSHEDEPNSLSASNDSKPESLLTSHANDTISSVPSHDHKIHSGDETESPSVTGDGFTQSPAATLDDNGMTSAIGDKTANILKKSLNVDPVTEVTHVDDGVVPVSIDHNTFTTHENIVSTSHCSDADVLAAAVTQVHDESIYDVTRDSIPAVHDENLNTFHESDSDHGSNDVDESNCHVTRDSIPSVHDEDLNTFHESDSDHVANDVDESNCHVTRDSIPSVHDEDVNTFHESDSDHLSNDVDESTCHVTRDSIPSVHDEDVNTFHESDSDHLSNDVDESTCHVTQDSIPAVREENVSIFHKSDSDHVSHDTDDESIYDATHERERRQVIHDNVGANVIADGENALALSEHSKTHEADFDQNVVSGNENDNAVPASLSASQLPGKDVLPQMLQRVDELENATADGGNAALPSSILSETTDNISKCEFAATFKRSTSNSNINEAEPYNNLVAGAAVMDIVQSTEEIDDIDIYETSSYEEEETLSEVLESNNVTNEVTAAATSFVKKERQLDLSEGSLTDQRKLIQLCENKKNDQILDPQNSSEETDLLPIKGQLPGEKEVEKLSNINENHNRRLSRSCENVMLSVQNGTISDELGVVRSYSLSSKANPMYLPNKKDANEISERHSKVHPEQQLVLHGENSNSEVMVDVDENTTSLISTVTVEPLLNLQFSSHSLRHLSSLSAYQLQMLDCFPSSERLRYITWAHVVFYDRPDTEIPCAIFLSNQALYFVTDSTSAHHVIMDITEFTKLKTLDKKSFFRFPFVDHSNNSKLLHFVIGLNGQYIRITGSSPAHVATVITRSSHLTENFVNQLLSALEEPSDVVEDTRRLLEMSGQLEDQEVWLSSGAGISLVNEQTMMEFNLTTFELPDYKSKVDKASQFILYLLVHLCNFENQTKAFILTTEFCCLCDENIVSYPVPEFETAPPSNYRFRDLLLLSLKDVLYIDLDDVVGYQVTIKSKAFDWKLTFRDYMERNKLIEVFCYQFELVNGSKLEIHCAI